MDWNAALMNKMRLGHADEAKLYRPLATTSHNPHQYTATFIQQHFKLLPGYKKTTSHQYHLAADTVHLNPNISAESREEDDWVAIGHMIERAAPHQDVGASKRIDKNKAKYAVASIGSRFRSILSVLLPKQQEYIYLEMKNDFLDYLFIPCFCCFRKRWMRWELKYPGPMNFFTVTIIVLCLAFYLLCFLWLFYPYQALKSCASETYVAYDSPVCAAVRLCDIPAMAPVDTFEKYFLFRLVIYGLSPISLISLSFFSHVRHQHMLHNLTGFPHSLDVYATTNTEQMDHRNRRGIVGVCHSCGNMSRKMCLMLTTIVIFAINLAIGVTTLAYDILFLVHASKLHSSDKPADIVCKNILEDTSSVFTPASNTTLGMAAYNNNGLQLDKFQLKLSETAYPIIVFNFVYTIWGFFFVIYVVYNMDKLADDPNDFSYGEQEDEEFLEAQTLADYQTMQTKRTDKTSVLHKIAGAVLHHDNHNHPSAPPSALPTPPPSSMVQPIPPYVPRQAAAPPASAPPVHHR